MTPPGALDELTIVGVEARSYVRGALDPRWQIPAERDWYVRRLLRSAIETPSAVELFTRAAAAFLAGWVSHRGMSDPPPPAQEPKRFPWEEPLPGPAEDPT